MFQRTLNGSLRLFRLFGISMHLHWTWFILVVLLVQLDKEQWLWRAAILGGVFGIVTLHEFGHALACRSVGGRAEHIVLFPLGGVAFVEPPQRPGPILWSIVAGPLVNVVLIPVLAVAVVATDAPTQIDQFVFGSELQRFVFSLFYINIGILCFNLLPIYPLDGGQILQSLLWFVLGRATSLQIVAVLGLIAAVVGGVLMLLAGRFWLVLMAVFIGWQALGGFRVARILAAQERYDRHT